MTYDQVIKYFGSEREAAYRLEYSEQALRHWKNDKVIPLRSQRNIEFITQGKLKADKPK